jgi:hypothetical protein
VALLIVRGPGRGGFSGAVALRGRIVLRRLSRVRIADRGGGGW